MDLAVIYQKGLHLTYVGALLLVFQKVLWFLDCFFVIFFLKQFEIPLLCSTLNKFLNYLGVSLRHTHTHTHSFAPFTPVLICEGKMKTVSPVHFHGTDYKAASDKNSSNLK